MARDKEKRGRRSHLGDFSPTASGEYVYTGPTYVSQGLPPRPAMALRWALSLGCAVLAAASGCLPAPGMMDCFYVILPWAASLLAAASLVWAAARMAYWGQPLREYVYQKTVRALPLRCALTAAAAGAAAVLSPVYALTHPQEEHSPVCTCLFFIFQIGVLGCALALRRAEARQTWKKRG